MKCENRTSLCKTTKCIDADQCNSLFFVEVESITGVATTSDYFVKVQALYNGRLIVPEKTSTFSLNGVWEEKVLLASVSSLPCETVLLFVVYEVTASSSVRRMLGGVSEYTSCLGHVHLPLCDSLGRMCTGSGIVACFFFLSFLLSLLKVPRSWCYGKENLTLD